MNKNYLYVIRIGLALVFLANSLTAFFAPDEFRELVGASFISSLLPISAVTLVLIISINDLLVAILLVSNKLQKYVPLWAMLWLIGVMVVIGEPLDVLEHLGFFSMALFLWLTASPNRAEQGK